MENSGYLYGSLDCLFSNDLALTNRIIKLEKIQKRNTKFIFGAFIMYLIYKKYKRELETIPKK